MIERLSLAREKKFARNNIFGNAMLLSEKKRPDQNGKMLRDHKKPRLCLFFLKSHFRSLEQILKKEV